MVRSYSISENPFVYGLYLVSFKTTDGTCGLKNFIKSSDGRKLGYHIRYNDDKPLTALEKGSYYAGRGVRLLVNVIGTIAELTLQILQSISTTFEFLAAKGESLVKRCHVDHTRSMKLHHNFSFTKLFMTIRIWATESEPSCLAYSLGLIGSNKKVPSLSSKYREFLARALKI